MYPFGAAKAAGEVSNYLAGAVQDRGLVSPSGERRARPSSARHRLAYLRGICNIQVVYERTGYKTDHRVIHIDR